MVGVDKINEDTWHTAMEVFFYVWTILEYDVKTYKLADKTQMRSNSESGYAFVSLCATND